MTVAADLKDQIIEEISPSGYTFGLYVGNSRTCSAFGHYSEKYETWVAFISLPNNIASRDFDFRDEAIEWATTELARLLS